MDYLEKITRVPLTVRGVQVLFLLISISCFVASAISASNLKKAKDAKKEQKVITFLEKRIKDYDISAYVFVGLFIILSLYDIYNLIMFLYYSIKKITIKS
jgi:hypothetical protein